MSVGSLKLEKSFEDTKKTFSNVMQSEEDLIKLKKDGFLSNNVQNLKQCFDRQKNPCGIWSRSTTVSRFCLPLLGVIVNLSKTI